MPKIQVDIPDALLESLRRCFEIRIRSTIPIANRHLIQWGIEQCVKDTLEISEKKSSVSHTSPGRLKNVPSLEEALSELDD